MAKLFNCVRMGSLVLAVTLLMAVSGKADIVLEGLSGSLEHEFGTKYVVGNSYSFSETFTLADENSSFTSFTLDAEKVNMFVQSVITNGRISKPEIDLSGTFTGLAGWSGEVVVKTSDNRVLYTTGVKDFSQLFAEMTYNNPMNSNNPTLISSGTSGFAETDWLAIDSGDLQNFDINLGADALSGVQDILFDFTLSDIIFDNTDFVHSNAAGNSEYFEASVAGLVSMTYGTVGNSTPATPEPASLLIFGVGMAGAGVAAYRKRRGQK